MFCQVCIYKGFCVKGGNFAIIMKLYSYSLAARVARHPGALLCCTPQHELLCGQAANLQQLCQQCLHCCAAQTSMTGLADSKELAAAVPAVSAVHTTGITLQHQQWGRPQHRTRSPSPANKQMLQWLWSTATQPYNMLSTCVANLQDGGCRFLWRSSTPQT
jgi:hypothetical protein